MESIEDQLLKIQAEIDRLFTTFDTRLLTTLMLHNAISGIRSLQSAKVWEVAEVRKLIADAFFDLSTPVPDDKVPGIITSLSKDIH